MPTRCIMAGCSNTLKDGVSLHRFPKDPANRRLWTAKVKLTRGKWLGPTAASVICSAHFQAEDFETGLYSQFGIKKAKQLRKNAVPNSVIKPTKKSKSPTKRRDEFAKKRERKKIIKDLLAEVRTSDLADSDSKSTDSNGPESYNDHVDPGGCSQHQN